MTRHPSPAELGQFAVVLVICLFIMVAILRAIVRRRPPRRRRSIVQPVQVHIPSQSAEDRRRELQALVDALRRDVEGRSTSPRGLVP